MPGEVTNKSQYPGLSSIPNFPVLVPQAIDHRSYNEADRTIITYPIPGTTRFVDVTWAEFGHAVDKAAWMFDRQLGARRSSNIPVKTVGILARSDAAYMVTVYALHKCGITPLLLSTRNSHAAIVNLLKLTSSVAILSDSYHRAEAEDSAAEVGSIPILDLAPAPGPVTEERRPFPFSLKYGDECDKPAIILHTSGSTGLPKPVPWSTRFFWHQTYYPAPYIAKYFGSSMLSTLPIFHGSGFSLIRAAPLWLGWKVVFPDSSKPVTASAIIELCNIPSSAPDIVTGAPSVIEEISTLPGGWEVMRRRKSWFFVGAPVPPHFGDRLVKEGVHFTPNLGSTEIGQMSVLEPVGRTSEDWNYHEIRPDLDTILEPRGQVPDSGPFELIILAKDGWTPGVVNINVNGIDGYATSDLYQKHSTKEHLLKHLGRMDDVVVLSNGEKTLSRAIEIPIEAHPWVRNAIVFGTSRAQNGVMIVPAADSTFDPADKEELAKYLDGIWPAVEQANSASPAHSQVWKEMILVTTPGKELPRTDKGSVKRKLGIEMYSQEIDALYNTVEESALTKTSLPKLLDVSNLIPYFRRLVETAMGKPLDVTDDVFDNGMDSLKAIFLRNSLLATLKKDKRTGDLVDKIPQNFVFSNTTCQAMGEAITRLVKTGHIIESGQETAEEHAEMINSMVTKYAENFPAHLAKVSPDEDGREVVILTGSTGSLGTYLLNCLISNPGISKIHAFNREGSSSSVDRQSRSYAERGLDLITLKEAITSGRLIFYHVQIHQSNFGLPNDVYESLRSSVTLVVHNAWALNFNWTLDTFEAVHIKGIRNLIDFALSSPHASPPRIAFTSSISTVGAHTTGFVPEEPLEDPVVCLPHGYARAKFVGERILALASQKTSLRSLCFRIGQISGDSVHGIWNEADSVPALVKGCQELGAIPSDWVPAISWTPADTVAQIIIEVCLDKDRGNGTFHITNPKPTPWSDLINVAQRHLVTNDDRELEVVTMREWVERLKGCGHSADANPATKLITFFENAMNGKGVRCRLGLDKTKEVSPTLKSVQAVDEQGICLFLDYWKEIQFLRASNK